MKRAISIFILFILAVANCSGQSKYFQPTGIIDRTKELSGKNIWTLLGDKESVDDYTRIGDSIFGGEIACNIRALSGIDVKTFSVLAGTKYAKDKNHVYFPLEIFCRCGVDCGVCFYATIIVENANPLTFKYLSKDYATDGKHVFFRGRQLPAADGATFKVIEGPEYLYFATDKSHVYKHNSILKDADPSTFYYDHNDSRNIVTKLNNKYIIGDKNKEWEFVPPNSITEVVKQQ